MSSESTIFSFNKMENVNNRVDFLDGYRGTLALWVFIHHCNYFAKLEGDYSFFHFTGYYIGVVGFFILSSYLLTYRLLKEMDKSNCLKGDIIIFIKYGIRRFFRIYIPFVFMCGLIKYVSHEIGGPFSWSSCSWYHLVTLKDAAGSQLWTIAPEIKYYFFLPVYVYLSHKMNKSVYLKITGLIINVMFLFTVEYLGLINEFDKDGNYRRPPHELLTRFTTFYLGSFLAVIIFNVQELELYKNISKQNAGKLGFGNLLAILSTLMYVYGMKLFSMKLNPSLKSGKHFFLSGLYWSIFMLMFILSKENFFTRFFNGTFLHYCGKFSFGIYLLHTATFIQITMKKLNLNSK